MNAISRTLLATSVLLVHLVAPLPASAQEAAPATGVHWYYFVVKVANATQDFWGSSKLDPKAMGVKLAGAEPIVLENLREFGIWDREKGAQCRPVEHQKSAHLIPDTVAYFVELTGDPLQRNK